MKSPKHWVRNAPLEPSSSSSALEKIVLLRKIFNRISRKDGKPQRACPFWCLKHLGRKKRKGFLEKLTGLRRHYARPDGYWKGKERITLLQTGSIAIP